MAKKTKIGENFYTHKPQFGLEHTPFLNAITRHRIELENCSNPHWMGKDLQFGLKKNFRHAISAFLAMFTKPQVDLTCFDRFL